MSFKGQLKAFAAKSDENMRNVTRKVIIDMGTRIIERTPVGDPTLWAGPAPKGYVGGRARGSWQYGLDEPSRKSTDTVDPSGSATLDRIKSAINPVPGIHFITSDLPYMPALENGWSTQAPSGMIGLVAVEFKNIVDTAVRGVAK